MTAWTREGPLLLVLVFGCLFAFVDAPQFTDVTLQAGIAGFRNIQGSPKKEYILETVGGGCAFLDYDNDGWLDVLLVGGTTFEQYREGGGPIAALYRNNHNGAFVDVTRSSGLDVHGWGMGCAVGDYNNDGFPDIYLTCYGTSHLFRNNRNGTFTDVTETAKVGAGPNGWATSAAFFDYDLDGLLDLYVCRYIEFDLGNPPRKDPKDSRCLFKGTLVMCGPRGLAGQPDILYRNEGDGTFSDVTRKARITDLEKRYYGLGVVAADYNNDGYPDLYVANDTNPNYLYRNTGDGTFAEEGLVRGVAVSEDGAEQGSMGVDAADYDNDGWLDIIVTNFSHDTNELYRNIRGRSFQDVTWSSGIGQPSWPLLGWGTRFLDYDNDGWLDLFVANGHVYPEVDSFSMGTSYRERPLLLHNQKTGRFVDLGGRAGAALAMPYAARGVAVGDYDNDGDLDLLINQMDGPPILLRNDGGNRKGWIQFKLVGRRSNRDAIGARIEINAGGQTQMRELVGGASYASSADMRLHFGLGTVREVAPVRIHWPRKPGNSSEYYQQTLGPLQTGQVVRVEEP